MATLPRPDVNVVEGEVSGTRTVDVVISRDGKAKSYRGEGTGTAPIKQIVEKMIGDPLTAEWLP